MWHTFLYQPLVNALVGFYHLFGSLGWAIIALTVAIRLLLLPLVLPSLKAAQKMKELAPELEKLKAKFKDDKQKLAQAQMDLYRQAGINPLAGLLPNILQIVVLIAMYQAFNRVLGGNGSVEKLNEVLYQPLRFASDFKLNLNFLYLNLAKPDLLKVAGKSVPGIFLIFSAVFQFLSAKIMMPIAKKQEKIADKTPEKKDDFASAMQTQSLYLFPAMTLLIGFSFPSGLVLYWLTFSVVNLIQQVIINSKLRTKK